jgi:hypothetical protein
MSASDPNTAIYLMDKPDVIKKKVCREFCSETQVLVWPFSYVLNGFGLRQAPYYATISMDYYLFQLFYRLGNTLFQVARTPRSSIENMELTLM